MVTKKELEELVEQVNQVLAHLDTRLQKLEKARPSTNTSKSKQNS